VALTRHMRAGPVCAAESFHHIYKRRCASAAVRPGEFPPLSTHRRACLPAHWVNRSLQPASQIRCARSAGTPVHRLPERPGLRVLRHAFESCSAARNLASEAAALAAPAGRRHEAAAHYYAGLQRVEQLHARKRELVRARAAHETGDWLSLHDFCEKSTQQTGPAENSQEPKSQPGILEPGSQAHWDRAALGLAGCLGTCAGRALHPQVGTGAGRRGAFLKRAAEAGAGGRAVYAAPVAADVAGQPAGGLGGWRRGSRGRVPAALRASRGACACRVCGARELA